MAVGDEIVSIDGYQVTNDFELFAKRAAAGVKDSLVKLEIRHTASADPEKVHFVVLQRADMIEPGNQAKPTCI